jgi:predicted Zn-dependent peptidase
MSASHYVDEVLENGLRVILKQMPPSCGPKVRTQLVYNFGSNAEVSDAERGLAHVIEHMLFKGTTPNSTFTRDYLNGFSFFKGDDVGGSDVWSRDEVEAKVREGTSDDAAGRLEALLVLADLGALFLSEADIDQLGRYYGASMNAFTSLDKTSYFFEVGREALRPFLCVLAAEMKSSRLDDEHLKSEIMAVLNEMSMGNDDAMRRGIGRLREQIYASNEAAHYDTIGSEVDLLKVNAGILRAFYEKHYKPWNATLYVVGDLHAGYESVMSDISRCFGKVALAEFKERVHPAPTLYLPAQPETHRSIAYIFREQKTPVFIYGFRMHGPDGGGVRPQPGPCGSSAQRVKSQQVQQKQRMVNGYYTPRAAAMAIGNLERSVLVESLLHSTPPLASSVECFVEQYQDSGEFYIIVTPVDIQNAPAIEAVLATLSSGAFWDERMESAVRNQFAHEWMVAQCSLGAFTNKWVDMMGCTHEAVALIFDDPSDRKKVSLDVAAFCSEHLQMGLVQTLVVLPSTPEHTLLSTEEYTRRWQERAARRRRTTAVIQRTRSRDKEAFPLEDPYTATTSILPIISPYDEFVLRFPGKTKELPVTATRRSWEIVSDEFTEYRHLSVLVEADDLVHTKDLLWLGLMRSTMSRTAEVRKNLILIEEMGGQVSLGAMATSITVPKSSEVGAIERLYNEVRSLPTTEPGAELLAHFEIARANLVLSLESQAFSGMTQAAHRLYVVLHAGAEAWDLLDAAKEAATVTYACCVGLYRKYWEINGEHEVVMRPLPRPSAGHDHGRWVLDRTEYKTSVGDDAEVCPDARAARPERWGDDGDARHHIPLQSSQTVIAFGRVGQFTTTAEEFMYKVPLLQIIMFHSLGSRIYQIRERTGLFYNAQGTFGLGATPRSKGIDRILTSVKPENVELCLSEIASFWEEMRTPEITAYEAHAAKAMLVDRLVSSLHIHAAGGTLVALHKHHPGLSTEELLLLPNRIASEINTITHDDLNLFCGKFFDAGLTTTVTAGPSSA